MNDAQLASLVYLITFHQETQEPLVHSTKRLRVTLEGGESFGAK